VSYVVTHMLNTTKHSGISGRPTQLLVVHSGECPLKAGFAQSLTNWANTTAVEASWHWFTDPATIVAMVNPLYAAWHASEANPVSEGFEQAGYARYSRDEWLSVDGKSSIDNLAWILVQRMKENDIPHRWLTTAEVNAITSGRDTTTKGLCLHRQIDPETRTDPGNNYPFDFLDEKIRLHLGSAPTPVEPTNEPEEEAMLTIFRDTAAADPDKTWIGNGLFKRHVASPQELADLQLMAREGKMRIFDNGNVQVLPEGLFGMDVGRLAVR